MGPNYGLRQSLMTGLVFYDHNGGWVPVTSCRADMSHFVPAWPNRYLPLCHGSIFPLVVSSVLLS
jgi:hypothetical protein